MASLDKILGAHDVMAVLAGCGGSADRIMVPVASCKPKRITEGTTGTLKLSYGGIDYADDVRIMRCQAPNGGDGWYRLGAQFLWTATPGEHLTAPVVIGLQPGVVSSLRFEANR